MKLLSKIKSWISPTKIFVIAAYISIAVGIGQFAVGKILGGYCKCFSK